MTEVIGLNGKHVVSCRIHPVKGNLFWFTRRNGLFHSDVILIFVINIEAYQEKFISCFVSTIVYLTCNCDGVPFPGVFRRNPYVSYS